MSAASPGSSLPALTAASSSQPAPRLSATHISTTTPSAPSSARGDAAGQRGSTSQLQTPAPSEVTNALLAHLGTPITAAQQLAARLAVTPSVLTPGVAAAVAAAGVPTSGNMEMVREKLAVLKETISNKTKKMSDPKRMKIEGQIAKLERSLGYIEQQRVSLFCVGTAHPQTGCYHCAEESGYGQSLSCMQFCCSLSTALSGDSCHSMVTCVPAGSPCLSPCNLELISAAKQPAGYMCMNQRIKPATLTRAGLCRTGPPQQPERIWRCDTRYISWHPI